MFCRSVSVSPSEVEQFASFFDQTALSSFSVLEQFYSQSLSPILEDRVFRYAYSASLAILLRTILEKLQRQPEALTMYPQIVGIGQRIAQFVSVEQEQEREGSPRESPDEPSPKTLSQPQEQASLSCQNYPSKIVLTCLGCTEFLVEGVNLRIPQLARTDVLVLPFATKIKQYKQELLQAVCALGNSNGGVILFDCKQKDQQILPVGAVISENLKQSIMQRLFEIFELASPKITFSKNAHLSFIPVAEQGTQEDPRFKEGLFVTRLRIWNNQRHRLFFYRHGEEVFLALRAQQEGSGWMHTLQVRGRKIWKMVKRYFKKYYLPEECNQDEKNLMVRHLHCFQDHNCPQPLPGIKVSRDKPKEPEEPNELELQQAYTYTSMVIRNKVPLAKIITYFVTQNITKFQLVSPKNEFGVANGIHILFHETSPYLLQERFEKMASPAKPILLLVDNAVKIRRRLRPDEFTDLFEELLAHNKQEWLNYYEPPQRRKEESILQTSSRVSVIYLTLKLRERGIGGPKLIRLDKSNNSLLLVYSKSSI